MLGEWINGWFLAIPLGILVLLGIVACSLFLLAVWLSRETRPTGPPHEAPAPAWPLAPRAAWERTAGAEPVRRPASPPRYTTFEEFVAVIESPQRLPGAFGLLGTGMAVVLAAALVLAPPLIDAEDSIGRILQGAVIGAFWIIALVQIVLGCEHGGHRDDAPC